MSGDYITVQFLFLILMLTLCLEIGCWGFFDFSFFPVSASLTSQTLSSEHSICALGKHSAGRNAALAFPQRRQTAGEKQVLVAEAVHLVLWHKQLVIWYMLHTHVLLQ